LVAHRDKSSLNDLGIEQRAMLLSDMLLIDMLLSELLLIAMLLDENRF
jgi:hypothetical protein